MYLELPAGPHEGGESVALRRKAQTEGPGRQREPCEFPAILQIPSGHRFRPYLCDDLRQPRVEREGLIRHFPEQENPFLLRHIPDFPIHVPVGIRIIAFHREEAAIGTPLLAKRLQVGAGGQRG